jgi:DNA-binding NtrC family response regulator
VSASPPNLSLLLLSDSFSEIWPALATECGLELAMTTEPAQFDCRETGFGVVCGAGREDQVETALQAVRTEGVELAAVGSVPDHRLAVSAILAGASQYFVLPPEHHLLRSWLRERAERRQQRVSGSVFAATEAAKYRFEGTLGSSPALREALERAARIIPHGNVTVLITGETGTGKELLARSIHYNGPRRAAAFVDVNCAAIPEQLLESELFGHEKGAFTGATSTKPGLFEVADGGTLFLDEIGHLSLALQAKLLRVLEQRGVRRVGGTRNTPVDVRVISATHVDLAAAARRGGFREDLFHRLNVVPIELPPLRARQDDILLLVRHFLDRFVEEYGVAAPVFTASAEQALVQHSWPGNIRELRNVIERTLLLQAGREVQAGDLALDNPTAARPEGGLPFPAPLAEIIRAAAESMTELCAGNKSESARRLGISRTRLLRLLGSATDQEYDQGDAS